MRTCLTCHNEESPNFKPFCFKERFGRIVHLDPRKTRTEGELKAMKCAGSGNPTMSTTMECLIGSDPSVRAFPWSPAKFPRSEGSSLPTRGGPTFAPFVADPAFARVPTGA